MQLDKYQAASSALSVSWKMESVKLLKGATDYDDFKKALIWCGKGGNVSRTVPSNSVDDFAKYMFDNIENINNGLFELSNLERFPQERGKKPWSWASKVCHIMNPYDYPLIYDKNIRDVYDRRVIRDVSDYEEVLCDERKRWAEKSASDIYKYDSDMWAKNINL